MNRTFLIKMIQAKQLEYQAIKEVIPETVVNRIEKIENEFIDIIKEYLNSTEEQTNAHTGEGSQAKASKSGTKAHKVTIE